MQVVNTALLSQPWNWVIIGLIAGFWVLFLTIVSPQPTPGE